jgi:large subunit ribosomal protein L15
VSDELNLSNLKPAQARKDRKRIGRGLGSGKGRYSGRGIKGQKSRAGSHAMPAGFEGGQMPIDMRVGKLRGNTSADAMPIGPFRTYNQPVNVGSLDERFDVGADVTLEALKEAGLISKLSLDVKILGEGELTKKLSVTAHSFSKSAVEKIEAAGGSVTRLREPVVRKKKKHKAAAPASEADETEVVEETEPEAAEPEATEPEIGGEEETE